MRLPPALCVPLALACASAEGPLPGCDLRNELTNADFVGGAALAEGTCWTVSQDLSLSDGTFTVERGVSVHFATGVGVRIASGGQLRLTGTEEAPIVLSTADPQVAWQGLYLVDSQGSDNVWEHVVIERAGGRDWTGAPGSGAAVYLDRATTLSMQAVTIRDSRSQGLLARGDVSLAFADGAFEGNAVPAHMHPEIAGALGPETRFVDNEDAHVRVVFGNSDSVVGDRTWHHLEVPYRVEDRFFVEGSLTLEPGTVVDMAGGASLHVRQGGELIARGTEAAPIELLGASATPGSWQGVLVQSMGGAQFDHCVIGHAGGAPWTGAADSAAAVYIDAAASAEITHTLFLDNGSYGVWAGGDARLTAFADNTFTGNARLMRLHPDRVGELGIESAQGADNDVDWLDVVMGNSDRVSVDATWHTQGFRYHIRDRFFVDATLDIDPGVALVFDGNVPMIVEAAGNLRVNGLPSGPVSLAASDPTAKANWVGIQFAGGSLGNVLTNTVISDTGSATWTGDPESDAALFIDGGAAVSLTGVEIGPGGGYGVFLAAADSTLTCTEVTFSGLEDGAIFDNAGNVILDEC